MADFSIKIESILDVDSCENILSITRWIKDCVQKAGFHCTRYIFEARFVIGEMSCTCKSEEEFKEHAFGHDIWIQNYVLSGYLENGDTIGFLVARKCDNPKNLFIICKSKAILAELVSVFRIQKECFEQQFIPATSAGIVVESTKTTVGTLGNNVQIDAENNSQNRELSNKANPTFWGNIWQTMISNLFWTIIVSFVLFILAYLGITQPGWLAL